MLEVVGRWFQSGALGLSYFGESFDSYTFGDSQQHCRGTVSRSVQSLLTPGNIPSVSPRKLLSRLPLLPPTLSLAQEADNILRTGASSLWS
ncbi:hypothetical protein LIER_27525 [Lithospermum erythrorhizon]|uniref:Uncharacterized protein n=1 Tax=Lithospermum erythrorhizon TaxID=34254 RepID=A0AAV3RCM9_LITER